MPIRIELLGRPTIVLADGTRVEHFPTRKAAALLGYLALYPQKTHSREQLTELFWPDVAHASGRNSLNVALNALRPYLGSNLKTDRTYVCLEADSLTTDLAENEALGSTFDPDTLLTGFYDDFVIQERERLKAKQGVLAPAVPSPPESGSLPPGGAVALDAPFYIERATDQGMREALLRNDSILLLKGAHEVGKTSLLARAAQFSRQKGAQVALTDLSTLPCSDATTFFQALATSLSDELLLSDSPEALWSDARSPALNLERFVRRVVLEQSESPVVWALDEVDSLFAFPFGMDLFRLFRSWHNRRSLEPNGPWGRLTLVIAYATEAQLFITDLHQSPFNVGTRLNLQDFTLTDIQELNQRFGAPLQTQRELLALQEWLGGQPYLNHLALHSLANGTSLQKILQAALHADGLFAPHLRRLLASLTSNPEHQSALYCLLEGHSTLTQEQFYRLRAAGILAGEFSGAARFRCRLYRDWLAQHLRP